MFCPMALTPRFRGTATLIDTAGRANDGVFVLDRQEGFFIETVEGVFVTFTMKRIGKKEEQD
jgi:hypothetical protein